MCTQPSIPVIVTRADAIQAGLRDGSFSHVQQPTSPISKARV